MATINYRFNAFTLTGTPSNISDCYHGDFVVFAQTSPSEMEYCGVYDMATADRVIASYWHRDGVVAIRLSCERVCGLEVA